MPTNYHLTAAQRQQVDMLKQGKVMGVFPMIVGERAGQKTFLMAVAISELAEEKGGVDLVDGNTGKTYHVPAGTPWQEALPVKVKP